MPGIRINRGRSPIFPAAAVAALLCATPLYGQTEEARTLELSGGGSVSYALRTHPADAHVARPEGELAPTTALDAARLLNLHLSAGDIEEAALLSNAPRRRFEELRNFRDTHGESEFRRVFAEYFSPETRLVAEIAIGRHRLLVWKMKDIAKGPAAAPFVAGQYFVEIDGRFLVDDVPNDTRASLRRILEAYRTGKLP